MAQWICNPCLNEALPYCGIEEEEFREVIYSHRYDCLLDFSKLDQLVFNPFELNENFELPLCDLDPDLQFFSDHRFSMNHRCEYFIQDTFTEYIEGQSKSNRTGMSIYLHNIKSIPKHYTDMLTLLNGLTIDFDVLGFTETWFSESTVDLFSIPGYQKPIHSYRTTRKGGGVSFYVRESIEFSLRTDLNINDGTTENIFIEIDKCVYETQRNIIIGLVYRPPNSSMLNFNKEFEIFLSKINKENKIIYLLGDYNINVLNTGCHSQTSEFVDILYSNHLFPLITKPTRIVGNKGTIIDNIITKFKYKRKSM